MTNKGYDPLHTRHYMLHLEEILKVRPSLARMRLQDMAEAPDMQFIFPLPSLSYSLFSPPAAAAKSLQSCPTLCDPIDGSPPGSPVPGILQARTLEWVAISFSHA